MAVKAKLLAIDGLEGVHCSDILCIGANACTTYQGMIPDLSLTLSKRVTYTVNGDDLMRTVDDKPYKCEFLLNDSLDAYELGAAFLKDHYSVYDLENFKMALGPVFDFDADA